MSDLDTALLLISLLVTLLVTLAVSVYGGFVGGIVIGTLCLIGFAVIPSTPFIPLWVVVGIVLVEVVLAAYKIAGGFGLAKGD